MFTIRFYLERWLEIQRLKGMRSGFQDDDDEGKALWRAFTD